MADHGVLDGDQAPAEKPPERKELQNSLTAQFVSMCVCVGHSVLSSLFATPWTIAHQAPLSKGFSRQEYWSGLPFPISRDLPDPGIEPRFPALQADTPSEPPGKPRERY